MSRPRRSAPRSPSANQKAAGHPKSVKGVSGGKNQLRIISGEWRGRKLPFPDGEGLRPTGDRMRETLFNWLSFDLYGRRVLDLFAGSGALGLEALSRGAKNAVFLDNHPGVVRQMKENLQTLKCERAEVFQGEALTWLTAYDEKFDLIFLDPPFGKGLLAPVCQQLEQLQRLADGALIYLEAEKGFDFTEIPACWLVEKEKKSGQVICRLYRREETR